MVDFDLAVIGGGIVGLSTAMQMTERFPGISVAVLEKEPALARHQTGRNSGVIHAGVYYQPGSLKAQFCREGVEATIQFCRERGIAYEQCGKLLVATEPEELPRMNAPAPTASMSSAWTGPRSPAANRAFAVWVVS
jgi:L-2-hydroxyglutarate oxidase